MGEVLHLPNAFGSPVRQPPLPSPGVVPQQAAAALTHLTTREAA